MVKPDSVESINYSQSLNGHQSPIITIMIGLFDTFIKGGKHGSKSRTEESCGC